MNEPPAKPPVTLDELQERLADLRTRNPTDYAHASARILEEIRALVARPRPKAKY